MVQQGLVTREQLNVANKLMISQGGVKKLIGYLIDQGLDKYRLEEFFIANFDISTVNLATFDISPEVTKLISRDKCEKYGVIPVTKMDSVVVIATDDPTNTAMREDLGHIVRAEVKLVFATEAQISDAIEHYYVTNMAYTSLLTDYESEALQSMDDKNLDKPGSLDVIDSDIKANLPTVVKFISLLLLDSIKKGASDIHLEPYEESFRIRFRIDGKLHEIVKADKSISAGLINRIKVMSSLAIEESRRPQDGRIKVATKNGDVVDFRVSILPTLFGQKCVLRLLNSESVSLDTSKLGMEDHQLEKFRKSTHQPHGIILLTGPTGSGKTTTIYSALSELNKTDVNISTVEDPVEINVQGINQVQVNKAVDLDFSSALRSLLRQDPDIMMVGEIRDLETAEIAIKASLTGHLVISTIHTNDAPSTITRLVDMGIQPFLISSSVIMIVAQRLVRKLCVDCATTKHVPKSTLLKLGLSDQEIKNANLLQGSGCLRCNGTGYHGRIAIYEVLEINEQVENAIFKNLSLAEFRKLCIENGMQSLRRSALNKLIEGVTSIDEVMGVCFASESSIKEAKKAS